MNVHISYKAGKTPEVEREFQHQFQKLERRLHVFNPDLVHFHAIVDQENGQGASTSLNLRLPSGQMAVQKSGENILAAVKSAFVDLLSQLTKHKELLRGQWNWKSRRGSGRRAIIEPAVPFEHTFAAVKPEQTTVREGLQAGTNGDISVWVNANLKRLERFVDRELRFREDTGQIRRDQVTREEVIDEVIMNALSEEHGTPDQLSLESWFYDGAPS